MHATLVTRAYLFARAFLLEQKPGRAARAFAILQCNLSLVALSRIVCDLTANCRIRIGANAVATDVIHAVRSARRPLRLIAAIRSSESSVRAAGGVGVA